MHSDFRPIQLQYFGTLTINEALNDNPIELLQAIIVADIRVIYERLSRGYPLDDKQAYAVKRIRRDSAGRILELKLLDRMKAVRILSKAAGWL